MRIIFFILMLASAMPAQGQIKFPDKFKLKEGKSATCDDDVYTNGNYQFHTYNISSKYAFQKVDKGVLQYLSDDWGFSFHGTKDGLCVGQGKFVGSYTYVVAIPGGRLLQLYSRYDDPGFVKYASWLLTAIRAYKKEGKSDYWPIHKHKGWPGIDAGIMKYLVRQRKSATGTIFCKR